MNKKYIDTRIFTKPISKTLIFVGRDWVGDYIYYQNLDVALMYLNILNTNFANF